MSEFLLVEVSPNKGARYDVGGDAVIGRENCEIEIPDGEVSRRHASIAIRNGKVEIEDLGSRNGTFVNEHKLDGAQQLRTGDRVRVGETVLQLEAARPPTPPEPGTATAGAAAPLEGPAGKAQGAPGGPSGDVPAPPEVIPSAVRRIPRAEAEAPPAFGEVKPPRRIRGSAARRAEATLVSYAVVIATAVAIVLYFANR